MAVSFDPAKPAPRLLSSTDMLHWSGVLILVLGIFFLCVWGMRKLTGSAWANSSQKMQVLASLSLGVRERVVLIQVEKKQLVLAITPGRIKTLCVMDVTDDFQKSDQLAAENNLKSIETLSEPSSGFAQKLAQTIKGQMSH